MISRSADPALLVLPAVSYAAVWGFVTYA